MTYRLDTSRTSANRATGRGGRRIRHITIHYWGTWVGQSHDGIVEWLCKARTPGTSAHYVVSPGLVTRIVPEADTSWANGNRQANQESVTIELCPDPKRLDQTIETCAELVRDIRGRHGDLPLFPHRKWTSTDCPGPFTNRLDEIDRLARRAAPTGAGASKPTTGTTVGDDEMTPAQEAKLDRVLQIAELLDDRVNDPTSKLQQAADRVMGFLVQRRDAKGAPARALDTLDGDTLRADIRAAGGKG